MALTDRPRVEAGAVLRSLAPKRQVFHSEADLQFAFAWEAKRLRPELQVRLETHPEPGVSLDLELIHAEGGSGVAIEFKYMTRRWTGTHGGEKYTLKSHGATDLRGYDVIKDIGRVERFVETRLGWDGFVIAMTNEPLYWRRPTHHRPTNAEAFRLYEGCHLSGERSWGPKTGGTSRGREAALALRDEYTLSWHDYSRIDDGPGGIFRVLVVPIEGMTR